MLLGQMNQLELDLGLLGLEEGSGKQGLVRTWGKLG